MRWCACALLAALSAFAQDGPDNVKLFDIRAQATTITQTHGPFDSPYTGANSLRPIRETDSSLTVTVFTTLTWRKTSVGFTGELAGGTGFSGVAGLAGFPNGEIPRVGKPTPTPYIANVYVKQSVSRATVTFGKVAATSFFDDNPYSHDPRTQFENWSLMSNAAWDYPADVRGYTVGAIAELHLGPVIFREGSFLEPVVANGPKLDTHFAASRGDTFEVQYGYADNGTVRILGFVNHANMGTYREAGTDVIATRKPGTIKYGFGINFAQQIAGGAGLFARLGWNDGKTESWAFTEVDRTATAGVSIHGNRWSRADDVFGAALAVNAISGDHRAYLARGGYGFLIGDGRLDHPGREYVFETYYALRVRKFFTVTPDYQFIANPAYNRDRGPAHVVSLRFHFEI